MDDIRTHAKRLLKEWSKNYNSAWPDGVLYTRFSPGGKQTDQSIEGQITVDKKFADDNHINIVDIFIDQHLTGTNDKRPDFQRMLALAPKASWSFCIVYDIERFGRNKDEIVINRKKLRDNKKIVLSATQINSYNLDGTRNISGIIMEALHEGMAEYYPVELSMKVKRGQRESLDKKLFLGGTVPFGYSLDVVNVIGKKIEKRLVIDEDRACIVRKIFALYLEGKTIEEIREYLSNNSIFNQFGRHFSKNQVIILLQNERYIGNFSYGGRSFENYQPAIIDKGTFMKAQERFKRNKANSGGGKAIMPYLLTTKLICGDCGSNMLGESGTSKTNKVYHYYKCFNKKKKDGCDMPAVPKDVIEEFVVEKTVEKVFKENKLEDLAHDLYLANEKEKKLQVNINVLQEQLADINKSISNIMKAIEEGLITSTTKERLLTLESEKDKIQNTLSYELMLLEKELPEEMILFFLTKMAKGNITDFEYKNRIIETFIEKVFLFKDKIVICYKFNDGGGKLDIDRKDLDEYIKKYEEKMAEEEFVYIPSSSASISFKFVSFLDSSLELFLCTELPILLGFWGFFLFLIYNKDK